MAITHKTDVSRPRRTCSVPRGSGGLTSMVFKSLLKFLNLLAKQLSSFVFSLLYCFVAPGAYRSSAR